MTPAQQVARIAAVGVPFLIVVAFLVVWSRLPEPLATQWGWAGQPSDSMSRILCMALFVGIWLVVAGREALPVRSDEGEAQRPPPVTMLFLLAAVLLTATAVILWANLDVTEWTAARRLPSPVFLPALFAIAMVGAGIGRWLERRDGTPPSTTPSATVALGPQETAVWFGRAHNYMLLVGMVGLAVFNWTRLGNSSMGYLFTALPLAIAAALSWVSVVIRDGKVVMGFGRWNWPKKEVRIGDIEGASSEYVQPMRYGGWGYRVCGSRCRAIVVRRGQALRLKMNNGSTLIVTVDDADEAAGLVNDLKTRQVEGVTRD